MSWTAPELSAEVVEENHEEVRLGQPGQGEPRQLTQPHPHGEEGDTQPAGHSENGEWRLDVGDEGKEERVR